MGASAGDLADKVIVVSGIGPGLGQAVAHACTAAGAHVVVAARTDARVEELAAALRDAGGSALGVVADITDAESREALVARTLAEFGRIDGLVNNAFVMGPMAKSADIDPQVWRDVFEVNVVATMALSAACAAPMLASGRGAIVMIGSQASRRSAARRGPYAASKAALLVAANVLANELGPGGVRVNSVVPAQIWGDSLAAHYESIAARRNSSLDDVLAGVTRDIPLRRITRPEEIADAVIFLLSDRASAITGQSLDVNGGNWFH